MTELPSLRLSGISENTDNLLTNRWCSAGSAFSNNAVALDANFVAVLPLCPVPEYSQNVSNPPGKAGGGFSPMRYGSGGFWSTFERVTFYRAGIVLGSVISFTYCSIAGAVFAGPRGSLIAGILGGLLGGCFAWLLIKASAAD